ncbi:phosphodiester glycosidase family protein [Roseimicrobium gellanilyticum]|uniref:phosphodiester glycosidase family protein n=1 Tax=Roseimicrobium gellanilyticum TaxID=748857 RepID=UPI001474C136|nr:phosphodiester glycosidase family protein [Roseimicrobium gellanilyticum]
MLLLATALVVLVLDHVFNLQSNATFLAFRASTKPLEVKTHAGDWKPVTELSIAELDRALTKRVETPGAVWKSLTVRRQAETSTQNLAQAFLSAKVSVIELSPQHYTFATSFKDKFALTTAKEQLETEDATFAITANFREPNGKPLGLVVHEGREVNRTFPAWTGYFFVKSGKPYFGPKSLFEETPGTLEEASQGYPSVMKNHTVFSYVDLAPTKHFDGNKITYRSLAGMRRDGTLVFIVSGDGGAMNVTEVASLAQKLNVQHATMLDGGRALQYSLRLAGQTHHFTAFNTTMDFDSPTFDAERSPIFLVAKPRTAP